MKNLKYFVFQIILISVLMNLTSFAAYAESLSSYSFVYNFGNAKIWAFIETNESLAVGPNKNSSILLTIYLEKLATNKGVFLNRVTFSFEGTQFERVLSPNVTLTTDAPLWSYNISFGQEDAAPILGPGQTVRGEMNFEFRYDVIDSTEDIWSYRVNERFPQTLLSTEQANQPLPPFETIFVLISLLGIGVAILLTWFKIRKYRKNQLPAHVGSTIACSGKQKRHGRRMTSES